jgi:hypothetical protein
VPNHLHYCSVFSVSNSLAMTPTCITVLYHSFFFHFSPATTSCSRGDRRLARKRTQGRVRSQPEVRASRAVQNDRLLRAAKYSKILVVFFFSRVPDDAVRVRTTERILRQLYDLYFTTASKKEISENCRCSEVHCSEFH